MLAVGDSALRKEAGAMTFVGCDLHTRMQQVAVLDTHTGEVSEHRLGHDGLAVEDFYAALPRPVTVGIESTGYAVWFHTLLPPRPWLQAPPPRWPGPTASPRAAPVHRAAPRSRPSVARRAQRADPGARRRNHDGGSGPP